MGNWYVLTWSWNECHYWGNSFEGDNWETKDTVFIPEGGSIKKYANETYDAWVADETVYEAEERGMSGYGVSCCLTSVIMLTADGQKIKLERPFF